MGKSAASARVSLFINWLCSPKSAQICTRSPSKVCVALVSRIFNCTVTCSPIAIAWRSRGPPRSRLKRSWRVPNLDNLPNLSALLRRLGRYQENCTFCNRLSMALGRLMGHLNATPLSVRRWPSPCGQYTPKGCLC